MADWLFVQHRQLPRGLLPPSWAKPISENPPDSDYRAYDNGAL